MLSILHATFQLVEVACWIVGQLFVTTRFADFALVKHKQYVTVANGTESVGNHYGSAAFHCPIERLLHDLLTMLIQGRGCLIEDDDFRVLDECPCNGDPLLLTSRKLATFEATILLETFMKNKVAFWSAHPFNLAICQLVKPAEI